LHPEFPIVRKLTGVCGENLGHIRAETNCMVQLRGLGSGHLEPETGQELPEPMFGWLTSSSVESGKYALEMFQDLLKCVYDEHQAWSKKRNLAHPSSLKPTIVESADAPAAAGNERLAACQEEGPDDSSECSSDFCLETAVYSTSREAERPEAPCATFHAAESTFEECMALAFEEAAALPAGDVVAGCSHKPSAPQPEPDLLGAEEAAARPAGGDAAAAARGPKPLAPWPEPDRLGAEDGRQVQTCWPNKHGGSTATTARDADHPLHLLHAALSAHAASADRRPALAADAGRPESTPQLQEAPHCLDDPLAASNARAALPEDAGRPEGAPQLQEAQHCSDDPLSANNVDFEFTI